MEKIIRVKCDDGVFDFLGFFVIVRRAGDDVTYELRGVFDDDEDVTHFPIIMAGFDRDFLLGFADYLMDMRVEACPSLSPLEFDDLIDKYKLKTRVK